MVFISDGGLSLNGIIVLIIVIILIIVLLKFLFAVIAIGPIAFETTTMTTKGILETQSSSFLF